MEKLKSLGEEEYLRYGLHLAILIGVAVAAVRYLNGEEVFNALRNFNYQLAPFILLISTAYLLIKAARFALLMEPFEEDLSWFVTFKAYVAGQAATLLPGGVAARAGLMKQVGVPVAESSVPVAFSSGIDQAVFIVSSLIAALWFEAARTPALIILGVLTVFAAIALVPTTRGWITRAADWIAEKAKVQEQWHHFLEAVPQVFTWRIMLPSLLLTLLAFAGKIVALDLAMRGTEIDLAYPTLFLGFILPTMMGRWVPIPGGVGVTEATMVGFLASASQAGPNRLAAAVAIFRIGTVFFPALLGAIVYFTIWKGSEEREEKAARSASS
jgi:uncharacterized protein (TIRG00374 family)